MPARHDGSVVLPERLTEASWRLLPVKEKRALVAQLRAARREKVLRKFPRPAALAARLDPSTRNPAHLQLLDDALADVESGDCKRLMVIMPPQEGKSERTSHYGVEWLLTLNPDLRIAIASYELDIARRWGQVIRDDLLVHELPLRLAEDQRAAGRWAVDGSRGSVYCVGVGGPLTGRPVDVLVIDDPVKNREDADSPVMRNKVWSWWTDVARTRLAPGGRVVLIMTRWHEDDLAGRLLVSEGADEWRVLHVPAQAEAESPAAGIGPDPLGRAPGEMLDSARQWEPGRWQAVRRDVGLRTWNALYQGRPSAVEGDLWKRQWWRRYDTQLWTAVVDEDGVERRYVPEGGVLCASWDLTFKDTKSSDFVVGQVWWLVGGDAMLLDQVRDRMDFPATLRAVEAMSTRWPQAVAKLVEEKANGAAIMSMLRPKMPGLIPVNPTESKQARAAAVAPILEGGQVWVPALSVSRIGDGLVEEAATFPNGTHDDQVDTASQALSWLFKIGAPPKRPARIIA